jgi:flagellar motor protein MotB
MRHAESEAEESYFVSMTDMLVGLIFIFIIMLMYFALQFRETTQELASADEVRAEILTELQTSLQARGVQVSIDTQTGVLRLPDEILFARGMEEPTPAGRTTLVTLSDVLVEVLPCYAKLGETTRAQDCPDTPHRIETLYIEGHTDSDPISRGERLRDNWDLSAARATQTYRALVAARPELESLVQDRAGRGEPLISVAGYADRRPVETGSDDAAKARNRRIDLRLVMMAPDLNAVSDVEGAIRGRL